MTNDEIIFKLEEVIQLRGFTPAIVSNLLTTAKVFIRHYDGHPIVDLFMKKHL